MPLLSIRDLVKVYQTDEGMFGKTNAKSAPSTAAKATAGRAIAPIS